MAAKKKRIVSMRIDEAALVDTGDNPTAHIVTVKAAADDDVVAAKELPAGVKTTAQIIAEREFCEDFRELRWAFEDSLYGIFSLPAAQMAEALKQTVDEFNSLTADLINGKEMSPASKAMITESVGQIVSSSMKSKDEFNGVVAKALASIEVIGAKREQEHMEPKNLEEVMALLTEPARLIVKSAIEQAGIVVAKAKEVGDVEIQALKSKVAELENIRIDAEMRKRAEAIPGVDVNAVFGVLKSAFARSKEEGEALETTLRAMGQQSQRANLTTEIGTAKAAVAGKTAHEQIVELAAVKAAEKGISKEVAYGLVCSENPALRDAAIAGR